MTAPNLATITALLERSMQKCSINQNHPSRRVLGGEVERPSSSEDEAAAQPAEPQHQHHNQPFNSSSSSSSSDTILELRSHLSLSYHWEQCLDLKTGEIYYINWRDGIKSKVDPRVTQDYNEDYYSEDDSSYDSEESLSESTPPSSSRKDYSNNDNKNKLQQIEDNVLVLAGCKSCFMYVMVPKQVEDCPKCNGQLLHLDASENGYP